MELRLHDGRPDRFDHRSSGRLDRDAPERHRRRGNRPLVLRPEAAAQPNRLRGRAVPVRSLRAAGMVALRCRRRRLQGRRGGDRRNRRAHAACPRLPRALQVRRDSADRTHRRARERDGRLRVPRRVPVGRRGAARRDGARRRVLRRRVGQVALRRSGCRVAVRASRHRRAARARLRRLAGARAAVLVRDGDGARARCGPLPHRHARRRGELRRERGLRDHRRDRRRPDPRELDAADRAPRRSCRRGRIRVDLAARPGDPRRLRRVPRPGLPGRARRARGPRHHLRHPARRGAALRAALLHDRRRDSLRRVAGSGDSRFGRAPRARRRRRGVQPTSSRRRAATGGAVGASSWRM